MTFKLYVSRNCGMSYYPEKEADTLAELHDTMAELDKDLIRWYLEKDGKDYFGEACAIHKGIIGFMQQVNGEK